MIEFEKTETMGWGGAIRGMRNPMNSWEKSDSHYCHKNLEDPNPCHLCNHYDSDFRCCDTPYILGPNDLDLARRLAKGGPVHAKYRRQIFVSVDITAPLYWWKEFDTYKVGTTANSCSTMHKIHAKEFTLGDFSCEHLIPQAIDRLEAVISTLNCYRLMYINWDNEDDFVQKAFDYEKKRVWYQMIQLLPSSYNQKRTVTMTYENLYNMYHSRKDHKLDEWRVGFCEWAKSLPYSELFTMEWEESHDDGN